MVLIKFQILLKKKVWGKRLKKLIPIKNRNQVNMVTNVIEQD